MAKVLIIDDSPTEMQILTKIMEENGYDVFTAENGESGIVAAKKVQPDVVLMDVVMPGMNGFQATRQLSKDAKTAHIPVIIITTKDQETDRIWGMRQGAKDFLTKPVQNTKLLTAVRNLVA